MAKRARGSTSRPGQRPPLQRQPARPPATPAAVTGQVIRPDELTPQEEARAAQLEAAIVEQERQSEAAGRRAKTARSVEPVPRAASTLEASAAEEYAYVARDVRRIAIVGGSMIALLFILWIGAHMVGLESF